MGLATIANVCSTWQEASSIGHRDSLIVDVFGAVPVVDASGLDLHEVWSRFGYQEHFVRGQNSFPFAADETITGCPLLPL